MIHTKGKGSDFAGGVNHKNCGSCFQLRGLIGSHCGVTDNDIISISINVPIAGLAQVSVDKSANRG